MLVGCAGTSGAGGSDSSGSGGSDYISDAGYTSDEIAQFRSALEKWNSSSWTWRLAPYPNTGTTRCGLGFDAAFPQLVLVTVLSTNGHWFQVSIDPQRGVKTETFKNGFDYNSALGDQSPEDFFATAEPCDVAHGGTVTLTNG